MLVKNKNTYLLFEEPVVHTTLYKLPVCTPVHTSHTGTLATCVLALNCTTNDEVPHHSWLKTPMHQLPANSPAQ